ncbi:MAG: PQQ-binding-like beta-propeller repeat protein [Planctomycetes bacterium]|nr:PQQ-binding-like beta-propeller repeat protein [Planctomycetota bacterium]
MQTSSAPKRWLAVAVAGALLAGAVVVALVVLPARQTPTAHGDETNKSAGDEPTKPKVDWPMYGGSPDRNFVNPWVKNIPKEWDANEGTNIKWSAEPGSKAYGGPTVVGGKVFIGTNNSNPRDPKIKGDKGVVMCFDEKTGKFLWQAVHDKLPTGRASDWPDEGICSSPTIEGDRLYYVSNRCEVVCADVNGDPDNKGKAKFLWKYDMIKEQHVAPHNLSVCSPLIVGDLIFIVTANGVDEFHIDIPQPEAPSFLALDKKGKLVWKSNRPTEALVEAQKKAGGKVDIKELINQGKLLMHGQWSNPVYAEPNGKKMVIFPGGDGWLYAFEPKSGELLWKFNCNPKDSFYVLGPRATRNDFIATPVVHDNNLYVGVGQDPEHKTGVGHLWCIDSTKTPKNEDKDLSPVDDNFDPKAQVNKDSALVWHYGGKRPNRKRGERANFFDRTMSTCAVHDGLCYVADLYGSVYCFDAKTGEKYWEEETKAPIWSSPYWVDGKVFIGNDDGVMYVFQHGKKKKILAQFDAAPDCKVRATPVAANGTLFLLTENETKLYAIAKGAKAQKNDK